MRYCRNFAKAGLNLSQYLVATQDDRQSSVLSRHKSNQQDLPTMDDRLSSELSRHRSSLQDLPTVDDRLSSELSRHRSNQRDLPTVDDRQSSELSRHRSNAGPPYRGLQTVLSCHGIGPMRGLPTVDYRRYS